MIEAKIVSRIAARNVKQGDKLRLLKNGKVERCDYSEKGVGFAGNEAKVGESVAILELPLLPPAGQLPDNIFNVLSGQRNRTPQDTAYEFMPQLLWDQRNDEKTGFAYYAFSVKAVQCPRCGTLMVEDVNTLDSWRQLERVGLRRTGIGLVEGKVICLQCEAQYYRELFTCDLCLNHYSKTEIQWQMHKNGHVYLCKTCFGTVNAKEWQNAVEQLQREVDWHD